MMLKYFKGLIRINQINWRLIFIIKNLPISPIIEQEFYDIWIIIRNCMM